MVTANPSTLTQDEVLFSWALAEAYSPRWREVMRKGLNAGMLAKLDQGMTDFTDKEKQALIEQLKNHRGDKIKGYIAPFTTFRLVKMAVSDLEATAVSPQISGWEKRVTLGQFIDGHYSEATYHDPRNAAKRMLKNPEPILYQGYPIISYSKKLGCPVLIDGYTRCIAAILSYRQGEIAPLVTVIIVTK